MSKPLSLKQYTLLAQMIKYKRTDWQARQLAGVALPHPDNASVGYMMAQRRMIGGMLATLEGMGLVTLTITSNKCKLWNITPLGISSVASYLLGNDSTPLSQPVVKTKRTNPPK